MVNKDMGSMVPGAMDKDITSWAGTYVVFEMVSRMEGSQAPCVDDAGAETCRWCRLSDGGMDNSLLKGMVYDKFSQFSSPSSNFFLFL